MESYELLELADRTGDDPRDICDRLGLDYDDIMSDVSLGADDARELELDLDDPEQFAEAWEMAYGESVTYIGADNWDAVYAHDLALDGSMSVDEALEAMEQEADEIERVLDLIRDGYSVDDALAAVRGEDN